MHILLIQPPIEDFYITPIRTYPLNLIYLASSLEAAGLEVSVIDCLNPLTRRTLAYPKIFDYLKEYYDPQERGPAKLFGHYYRFGLSDEDILKKIALLMPDAIGISANFTAYFDTVETLCRKIKKTFPAMPIILGGYHATVFSEEIKQRLPDVEIISGEGERPLLAHLGVESPDFSFETFIPNHRFITPSHYQMHRQNMVALVASRGCVKACTFCTVSSMYGRSMRWRTLDSILSEMKTLYDTRDVRVFDFEDDNLSINRLWFTQLLNAIIENFTDIRLYAMNGLAMETLDAEMLALMWTAGFRNLNLSLVTAQESEQSRLNRGTSNAVFDLVVRDARALGFEITVYFILGLPNQTAEDVKETLKFLYTYDVLVAPSVFYPPPGTPLYQDEPWMMCRSSAFAKNPATFPRSEQVEIFRRVRVINAKRAYDSALKSINV